MTEFDLIQFCMGRPARTKSGSRVEFVKIEPRCKFPLLTFNPVDRDFHTYSLDGRYNTDRAASVLDLVMEDSRG